MSIDHAALAPLYALAATAILVLLVDLLVPRLALPLAVVGVLATGVLAMTVTGTERRRAFCDVAGCSYATDVVTVWATVAVCGGALVVLLLSIDWLAARPSARGEYVFLLLCSTLGAALIVGSRDLLTLVVGLETLTVPTYVLVGLGRGRRAAGGALTYFVVSIVATSVLLLGIALCYAGTGTVHIAQLAAETAPAMLTIIGAVALTVGLLFKLAAMPFSGWAPASYDGAPLPVAAFLATVSKLGGVAAVVIVVSGAFGDDFAPAIAPVLLAAALVTMTVGNLVALQQQRMLRLLAWSSVAQLGFVLAPFGLAASHEWSTVLAGALGYLSWYLLITLALLAAIVAVRPRTPDDGGTLDDYRGLLRRRPWLGAALVFGLIGLAGLPPALAGLWAKVAVIGAVVSGTQTVWSTVTALVIAVNIVVGLAVYLRVVRVLWADVPAGDAADVPADRADAALAGSRATGRWAAATAGVATLVVLALGVWPQPLFHATTTAGRYLADLWTGS